MLKTKYDFSLVFLLIVLFVKAVIYSGQSLPGTESICLKNIEQVTFVDMGFEKAGESYFSPDGKSIIFQAVPKGKQHYQIYTINLETSDVRMVSTGRGACSCGYFRPDGKKIIFASSHGDPNLLDENSQEVPGYNREGGDYKWEFTPYMNIYEANLDGSGLRALTTGSAYHAECAYSPDGKKIVFASNDDGHMNIYVMDSDGSNLNQVTHDKGVYNGGTFFSPDGKKIIYRADYDKKHYLQIYCINVDGTDKLQLTDNGTVNWAPYWHPNGKVIAFTTAIHGHHNYELYLINVENGLQSRLTCSDSFDGLPSFNKYGDKITWTSKRTEDKTCQVFVADFIMPNILD